MFGPYQKWNPFDIRNLIAPWRMTVIPFLDSIAGAVGGAIVSDFLSSDDQDAANAAVAAQADAAGTQAQISLDQWNRYKELYGPLEEQMIEDVNALPGPDYQGARDRATADVVQSYSKARGMLGRDMARMGMNPGSGAALDRLQRGGLEFTKANIQGRNASRLQEDEKAYRNLQAKGSVASMGRGLPSSAMQGLSSAAAGYGNVANYHAQSAAGTGQFVGNMTGRIMQGMNGGGGGGGGLPGYSYTPFSGTAAQAGQNFDNMDFDDINAFSTQFADGGEIRGPGDGTSDSINGVVVSPDGRVMDARFSDGEYVIPKDVKEAKGTEFFDKLIEKHHTPVQRGMPMMGRAQ